MQLSLKYDKPTCQGYHEKSFDDYVFNWELIHRIPRIATFETKIRIFQYNPFAPCAPLDSNISKTVRVNIAFALIIFKRIFNKLSNGIQVDTLCTCGSQVIDL